MNTEIDLVQLFANGITFLKKKKGLILSFFIAGLLYGSITFFFRPPTPDFFYKKDFIVESSILPNDILFDIINDFQLKLNNGKELSEPVEPLSMIQKIKSSKVKLHSNINSTISRLRVTVEAYEKQNIDSLINGIAFYVNSNEYIKLRYSLINKQNLQLLSVINKQIEELNSLKHSESVGNNTNRKSEYLSYVDLIEKKQKTERDLTLNKTIEFIEINSSTISADSKAGIRSILGYSILGIFIGIIVAGALHLFSKIKQKQ